MGPGAWVLFAVIILWCVAAVASSEYRRITTPLPGSEEEWQALSPEERNSRIRALEIECGLGPSETLPSPQRAVSVPLGATCEDCETVDVEDGDGRVIYRALTRLCDEHRLKPDHL